MKAGRYELFGYQDTRSFLYVDDAIRATMMVADAPEAAGEIVNVGGAEEITMLELGCQMLAAEGVDAEIALHDSPAGSVRRRAPDIDKLRRLTGFAARVPLAEGLQATGDFYLRGRLIGPLRPQAPWQV